MELRAELPKARDEELPPPNQGKHKRNTKYAAQSLASELLLADIYDIDSHMNINYEQNTL